MSERTSEEFLRRTATRIAATTVAVIDGNVVGFVVVIDDEVEQIYVNPASRGSGVADELITPSRFSGTWRCPAFDRLSLCPRTRFLEGPSRMGTFDDARCGWHCTQTGMTSWAYD